MVLLAILFSMNLSLVYADPGSGTSAELHQQILPQLEARKLSSTARLEASKKYFNGEIAIFDAWPELVGAPLTNMDFLNSRLLAITKRSHDRAIEINQSIITLSEEEQTLLNKKLQEVTNLEEQADLAEMKLLSGIWAAFSRAPLLNDQNTKDLKNDLQTIMANSEQFADQAIEASETIVALKNYQNSAISQWTILGNRDLDNLIAQDLENNPNPKIITRCYPLIHDPQLSKKAQDYLIATLKQEMVTLKEQISHPVLPVSGPEEIKELIKKLELRKEPTLKTKTEDPVILADFETQKLKYKRDLAILDLAKGSFTKQDINLTENDDEALTEAKRKAEEANSRAQDEALSTAEATLKEQVASLRTTIAELVEKESLRRAEAVKAHKTHQTNLASAADALAAALALPPLDSSKHEATDSAYEQLSQVVVELREERSKKVKTLKDSQNERKKILEKNLPSNETSNSNSPEITLLLTEASEAKEELGKTLNKPINSIHEEILATGLLLEQAKIERRRAKKQASSKAVEKNQSSFIPELIAELKEIPLQFNDYYHRFSKGIKQIPKKLMDISAVGSFLYSSLELIGILLLWHFAKQFAPNWLGKFSKRKIDLSKPMIADFIHRMFQPGVIKQTESLVRKSIDLFISGILCLSMPNFLTWCIFAITIWRFVPAFINFTTSDELTAEAFSDKTKNLISITAKWMIGLWLLNKTLGHGIISIFQADRVYDLVSLLINVVFWFMLIFLIGKWGPILQNVFANEAGNGRLSQWISQKEKNRFFAFIKAILASIGLMGRAFQVGSSLLVRKQGKFGWLGAILAKRQLKETVLQKRISQDLFDKLLNAGLDHPNLVSPLNTMLDLAKNWPSNDRIGLCCLVTDRGMGKEKLLQALSQKITVKRIMPPKRIIEPSEAFDWLSIALDFEKGLNQKELIEKIASITPSVLILENAERLFQRSVSGFGALEAVLEILHSSSREHFWIVTFHRPTWTYLKAVPGAFETAIFSEIIEIEPLSPDLLESWLNDITIQHGIEISYDMLAGVSTEGGSANRTRKLAAKAYWRHLFELSMGNPAVAKELWLNGLGDINTNKVEIGLGTAPSVSDLSDLNDSALFVLTALVIHDRVSITSLSAILNMGEAPIMAALRRLEAKSVIQIDENSHFRLRLSWIPAVHRLLRQKNFLLIRN